MPNRNPKVTVRHPKLKKEVVVRQRQADVLAKSGWQAAKPSTNPKEG